MESLNHDMALHTMHLFAGAGGGILADLLLGHTPICAVEIEEYPRNVLLQRQIDGILPRFPIWDDVQTFDGKPWRGKVDIVAGGFPCTDISAAGKGAGITGPKSSLWKEMARIIGEVRPRFAFVENSPLLVRRGLTTVLGDFAEMGYDARWCVLGADDVGAPHRRKRIWILGSDTDSFNDYISGHGTSKICRIGSTSAYLPGSEKVCNSTIQRFQNGTEKPLGGSTKNAESERSNWWSTEPDVGRVANGVASRVDRIKSIGNGQVPLVAATAWRILTEGLIQ